MGLKETHGRRQLRGASRGPLGAPMTAGEGATRARDGERWVRDVFRMARAALNKGPRSGVRVLGIWILQEARWSHGLSLGVLGALIRLRRATFGVSVGEVEFVGADVYIDKGSRPGAEKSVADNSKRLMNSKRRRVAAPGGPRTKRMPEFPGPVFKALRIAPRRAKKPPRQSKTGPRRPKIAPRRPRWPPDGPRGLQDAPRGLQEHSQEGPKEQKSFLSLWKTYIFRIYDFWGFTASKIAQEAPKIAPRRPNRPP